MRSLLLVSAAAAVAIAQAGCIPLACSDEARAGIIVHVYDRATSAPISDASVVLTDGAYRETLESDQPGTYEGARERPGIYSIEVDDGRHLTGFVDGVVVDEGDCHVFTQTVTVVLIPGA